MILHPLTGELLPEDDWRALKKAEEELTDYLSEVRRKHRPIYAARDEIRTQLAALAGTPDLPGARYRTPTQEKVARCPRCNLDLGT